MRSIRVQGIDKKFTLNEDDYQQLLKRFDLNNARPYIRDRMEIPIPCLCLKYIYCTKCPLGFGKPKLLSCFRILKAAGIYLNEGLYLNVGSVSFKAQDIKSRDTSRDTIKKIYDWLGTWEKED